MEAALTLDSLFTICSHDGMTRGDLLRYRIAFALSRASKIIRGLKQGLTEAERYAVADHVVAQLKERGDPWRLSEEAKPAPPPTT
jgi:hypothetical protein